MVPQPIWKIYASQIGWFPQVRVNIKQNLWNHHLVSFDFTKDLQDNFTKHPSGCTCSVHRTQARTSPHEYPFHVLDQPLLLTMSQQFFQNLCWSDPTNSSNYIQVTSSIPTEASDFCHADLTYLTCRVGSPTHLELFVLTQSSSFVAFCLGKNKEKSYPLEV